MTAQPDPASEWWTTSDVAAYLGLKVGTGQTSTARRGLTRTWSSPPGRGGRVESRNLARSFARICDDNGIRRIRVHALRPITASLLKKLAVPPETELAAAGPDQGASADRGQARAG